MCVNLFISHSVFVYMLLLNICVADLKSLAKCLPWHVNNILDIKQDMMMDTEILTSIWDTEVLSSSLFQHVVPSYSWSIYLRLGSGAPLELIMFSGLESAPVTTVKSQESAAA